MNFPILFCRSPKFCKHLGYFAIFVLHPTSKCWSLKWGLGDEQCPIDGLLVFDVFLPFPSSPSPLLSFFPSKRQHSWQDHFALTSGCFLRTSDLSVCLSIAQYTKNHPLLLHLLGVPSLLRETTITLQLFVFPRATEISFKMWQFSGTVTQIQNLPNCRKVSYSWPRDVASSGRAVLP